MNHDVVRIRNLSPLSPVRLPSDVVVIQLLSLGRRPLIYPFSIYLSVFLHTLEMIISDLKCVV